MAAEQKLVPPGFIAVQFNHANRLTATVDMVVLGKFQAACISKINVELTTFLLCVLTIKRNGERFRCFMAGDVKCSRSTVGALILTTHVCYLVRLLHGPAGSTPVLQRAASCSLVPRPFFSAHREKLVWWMAYSVFIPCGWKKLMFVGYMTSCKVWNYFGTW